MSEGSHDWLPLLTAKTTSMLSSSSQSKSVSDVLTSELLRGAPATPPKDTPTEKKKTEGKSPPLERLEVETDLSVSVAMSIPYYNLSNYSRLLNTVNLLQTPPHESTEYDEGSMEREVAAPAYANTSHLSGRNLVEPTFGLNQVPPRFSQFILDQHEVATVVSTAGNRRSRDISNLMGSQATIFSTRELSSGTLKGRKRSRKSRVNASGEELPLLSRRRAIRFKEGGLAYRLGIRMRRIAASIKNKSKKIWRFVAGSKKGTRAKMAKRKNRNVSISAPLTNPTLGETGASRVPALTSTIKFMAGQDPQPKTLEPSNEYEGKMTHLSNYLSEQRHLSAAAPGSLAAFLAESSAPNPPPHKSDGTSGLEAERIRVQTLWKQYLCHVLAQRIQLRQEISVFQALLAGQMIPDIYHKPEVLSSQHVSIESIYSTGSVSTPENRWIDDDWNATPKTPAASETPEKNLGTDPVESLLEISASSEEIPDLSDTETVDLNMQKLQHVLNRRSVLGEMLDYESDELELVSSGDLETSSPGFKRYGTVKRHLHESSSKYLDSLSRLLLPRSLGISEGLHLIATQEV